MFVRPKGVCTLCTPLCTGGLSDRILVASSWFYLHHFMQFSVSGDMTLRLSSSVSVDVPGSAGTSLGLLGPVRRLSRGVWDPDSPSGAGSGLVDQWDLVHRGRAAIVFPPMRRVSAVPAKKGVPSRLAVDEAAGAPLRDGPSPTVIPLNTATIVGGSGVVDEVAGRWGAPGVSVRFSVSF